MADRETHYRLFYDENEVLDTKNSEVWCEGDPLNCLPTVVVTPNNVAFYNDFKGSVVNNNHWAYFTSGDYLGLMDTLDNSIYNDIVDLNNHFLIIEVVGGHPFYTLVDTSIHIGNFSATDVKWAIPAEE